MSKKKSKRLHITLWVAQFVLGLTFSMAGIMKLITPVSTLKSTLSWVNEMPEWVCASHKFHWPTSVFQQWLKL